MNRLTSQKEKQDLMAAFRTLDTNKDGILSKEELKSAFSNNQDLFGFGNVDQLMETLDTNSSGFIDYSGNYNLNQNLSLLLSLVPLS